MKTICAIFCVPLLLASLAGPAHGVMSDSAPRAMGLGQAYTAMARGAEAVFWNPANLGLSGSPRYAWPLLSVGTAVATENNSFSVSTYNDHFTEDNAKESPRGTLHYISQGDKEDLLDDVPGEGLRMDVELEPIVALALPVNNAIVFPMPHGLQSSIALGFTAGFEGEIPKDMVELFLFGNEFAADRVADGKPASYDISEWDGSAWAIGSLNWSLARTWMPHRLAPYLQEFSVGGTLKLMGGAYGEIVESGGEGVTSRFNGALIDAYAVTQSARGRGLGIDLGVAGVTMDGKTTVSLSVLNFLDIFSWSVDSRQDSVFITARDLYVTRFTDPDERKIENVLDNPDLDGDGDVDFHKHISNRSFSRSLPAVLRVGMAHELRPRLTVAGAYDQAFTNGFGISTTPRLALGGEYRLVEWFPFRAGLSAGGRYGVSSSVGWAFGPFPLSRMSLCLLDMAFVARGGVLPGLAKGTAVSAKLFELSLL